MPRPSKDAPCLTTCTWRWSFQARKDAHAIATRLGFRSLSSLVQVALRRHLLDPEIAGRIGDEMEPERQRLLDAVENNLIRPWRGRPQMSRANQKLELEGIKK